MGKGEMRKREGPMTGVSSEWYISDGVLLAFAIE